MQSCAGVPSQFSMPQEEPLQILGFYPRFGCCHKVTTSTVQSRTSTCLFGTRVPNCTVAIQLFVPLSMHWWPSPHQENNRMPQWILLCQHCTKGFRHTKINPAAVTIPYDPLWPSKPDFPEGGQTLSCPHCKVPATYQRYQLIYSAEPDRGSFLTDLPATT
jgi:hypothetical protein